MDAEPRPLVDDRVNIPDDTLLYRRVPWDLVGGKAKCPLGESPSLSGNAFRDWSAELARSRGYAGPCMSVGVGTMLNDPQQMLGEERQGYGVAVVRAGDMRTLTRRNGTTQEPQGIMLSPTDAEPWHGVVFCLDGSRRKDPVCAAISDHAAWVIPLLNDD